MKKLTVIAALGTLVLSLGTSVLSATTADALASEKPSNYFGEDFKIGNAQLPKGCPGSIVDRGTVNGGNYSYDTYYSSAAGGRLCLVVHNNTPKPHDMQAVMVTRAGGSRAIDAGIVRAYIGPVQLSNVDGKCILIYAQVKYQDQPSTRLLLTKKYQVVGGKLTQNKCLPIRKV